MILPRATVWETKTHLTYALTGPPGRGTSRPNSDMRAAREAKIDANIEAKILREGRRQMTLHTGRHFLQIPGPTNVPDRVLRAMDMTTLDHRGPEFAVLGHAVLAGIKRVF